MKKRLLTLLRVPERPDPPPGAGESLETFRAAQGFFYYSILAWIPKQLAAFSGLLFSLAFFGNMGGRLSDKNLDFISAEGMDRFVARLSEADIGLAWMRFDLGSILLFFELLAVATWLGQLVFTGISLRLAWEQRWYLVGERSLRIRHGLWSVREQTMTIANIQNMIVRQGPVQRLFKISDLEVHTAGGGAAGSSGEDPTEQKDSFHVGRFRGITDASALRNKIRARLQAAKAAGASNEAAPATPRPEPSAETGVEDRPAEVGGELAAAARDLLTEARALRRVSIQR